MNETGLIKSVESSTKETDVALLQAAQRPMCDVEGCNQFATHSFISPWSSGNCCAHHQRSKAQLMKNLKRQITFGVIVNTAPAPLQRDERVKLRATIMVQEEELKEVRIRAEEMYLGNQKLVAQVQRLSMVETELKAQAKDAKVDTEAAVMQLLEREEQLAESNEELSRLRVILGGRDVTPTEQPTVTD